MGTPDADRLAVMARAIAESGEPPLETWLEFARGAPEDLASWPAARTYQHIRCRLRYSQSELAAKTGLSQSNLSRIEAGEDCLLSTMRRLYEAMGLALLLVPKADAGVSRLLDAAEDARPPRRRFAQTARPRRVWVRRGPRGAVEESLDGRPFPTEK